MTGDINLHDKQQLNVLITATGRKVALLRAFQEALKSLGLKGNIIAADMNTASATMWMADKAYRLPPVADEGYVPALLEICRREQVKLLVPLYEPEFTVLDRFREEFLKLGVVLLLSGRKALEICNDKYLTYRFLLEIGVPTARSFLPESLPERSELQFPLFIKPRYGMGSAGAYRINNLKELDFFANYVSNPIIQECLTGTEYTMDVLSDLQGQVVSVVPRERTEVRAGEVSKSRTVDRPDIIEYTVIIAEKLGLIGPSAIQCFETDKGIVFTEINPRFGGGAALSFAAGANYPEALLRMALGQKVAPFLGRYKKDLIMLRYDEALYLEPERAR